MFSDCLQGPFTPPSTWVSHTPSLEAIECLETSIKTNVYPCYQHAHPSLSLSKWMSIGSEKSPLYSSDSSCANAFLAITVNKSLALQSHNHYKKKLHTFKSLFNVHCLLCTGFEIWYTALRLAERHCSFGRYHPLILLHINLVTKHHL